MSHFFKNSKLVLVSLIAVLLIALMVVTTINKDSLGGVENVVGEIVTPIQNGVYSATNSTIDFFYNLFNQKSLLKQNKELSSQIQALQKENSQLSEYKKQNNRMKGTLGFIQSHPEYEPIGANVIAKNPGNWFNIIAIDKGKNQGVGKDMPVISGNGLVGRVIDAGADWAKVLCIVDSRSSVSAIDDSTRDNGVVQGNNSFNSQDGTCSMTYLPLESKIAVGNSVLTSGLGGVIPKGIMIGVVTKVGNKKGELRKYAVIKPVVDFMHLEEVVVIKSSTASIKVE